MKMLRYLFAIVLVFGLTNAAKAGPVGFQMVVVDPTVPIDIIQPVFTDNFALTFPTSGPAAGCSTTNGQLPPADAGENFTACFTGVNLTGAPLTSLEIELPEALIGSLNCADATAGNDFNVSCSQTNGDTDYLFDFTGGDIPTATLANSSCFFDPIPNVDCSSPAIFTIAIGAPGVNLITDGVAGAINDAGVVAQGDVTLTPEPSSLLLMSTGVFSLGLFGAYRRRQNLVGARANLN